MIPKRVLSLSLGISSYPKELLKRGERALEFLDRSAVTLAALFAELWPNGESKHIVLSNDGATFDAARLALQSDNEFDLLLIYLGGHGRLVGGEFQFVFHGGTVSHSEKSTVALDALLSAVKSRHTLLLLDCCHAGAFVTASGYFRDIGGNVGRTCIASCLADQLSWEDRTFAQSLFAHGLTEALSDASLQFTTPLELFRHLAQAVPKHAFALRSGAAQEPVFATTLREQLEIPVGKAKASTRGFTTFETLVRRTRQIAVTFCVAAALGGAGLTLITWRPALNERNLLELRYGPKWLSFINIGPLAKRVELPFGLVELKSFDGVEDVTIRVTNETGLYVWPGNGTATVRRWADNMVEGFLSDASRRRWQVHLGYEGAVDELVGVSGRLVPTKVATVDATALSASATLLDPMSPLSEAWRIQWQDKVISSADACVNPNALSKQVDRIDFYLHLSTAESFSAWLDDLRLTSAADSDLGLEQVIEVVEMFAAANVVWQRWFAEKYKDGAPLTGKEVADRYTERPSPAERLALERLAEAIVANRVRRGEVPVTENEKRRLNDLSKTSCRTNIVNILSRLGSYGDPKTVSDWARDRPSFDQGRIPLLRLAQRGGLSTEDLDWVLGTIGIDAEAADLKWAYADFGEWLTDVATVMPVPQAAAEKIMRFAELSLNTGDMASAKRAVLILAHTKAPEEPKLRRRFDQLVAAVSIEIAPGVPTAETIKLYGVLAKSGYPLSFVQRHVIVDAIWDSSTNEPRPVHYDDRDSVNLQVATNLAAGNRSTDLIAVAGLVLGSDPKGEPVVSDSRTLAFFIRALADGYPLRLRNDIKADVLTAAAKVWSATGTWSAAGIRERLQESSWDGFARKAISEIASVGVIKASDRQKIIDELRTLWKAEREPEVKLALAEVILGAYQRLGSLESR